MKEEKQQHLPGKKRVVVDKYFDIWIYLVWFFVSCLSLHAIDEKFQTIDDSFTFQYFRVSFSKWPNSALHLAIINEIPNVIWLIRLAPQPWLLDLKNDDAQAPIHLAVLTRQADVVRHLLISGAKVRNV